CVSRTQSKWREKYFPELTVPPGCTWFFVSKAGSISWERKKDSGILPDYRLVGGWNDAYKEKFKRAVIEQLKKDPGKKAYYFGSEWPSEIKNDPHYPDLVIAYAEAVKSLYPDAWVYEAGYCNMEQDGIAQADRFLTRVKGKWQPDFLATHTYVKDITQLYPNFKDFLAVAEKHGYGKSKLAFPEGMSFCPYEVPEWGRELVAWMGDWWRGGTLSYDLGWAERLSAACYMRCYLVFLTEFERVWCATSSAECALNFALDVRFTPRAFQKVPNTLGILLGNPRKFLGNYTFAPETKCLVWLDEEGRPLAAVWNEDKTVNRGMAESPWAKMSYTGAEYIDMMGVRHTPGVDGEFYVSPFPLFIRGKKGDEKAFVRAISESVLQVDKLPIRIGDDLVAQDTLRLTLSNDLSKPVSGVMSILEKQHRIRIPRQSKTELKIQLPKAVSNSKVEDIRLPIHVEMEKQKFDYEFKTSAFAVRKFNGDWSRIPAIPLTNYVAGKTGEKSRCSGDFEATFQVAWDSQKLYLRINVTDDCFTPGDTPGNRWSFDSAQVYFDTRCSARKTGKLRYDEDDYEYTLMPTVDGKHCEVFRARSPDMQLTLGTAAPRDNTIAGEIPAKFRRTPNGYIYEVEFPAAYLLPARLEKNYNLGFALMVVDRDKANGMKQALSLSTQPGAGCYNRPHLWPMMLLAE
ncbi:MAG: sugar-binding protein, partial [Victivallales bacterium]|nr:sugar-binding protein [Victivallales bacterium]